MLSGLLSGQCAVCHAWSSDRLCAANVSGVFAVEPLRLAEVSGRHAALVDHLMSSGATMFEVARVQQAAGASSVQGWVLARTPE